MCECSWPLNVTDFDFKLIKTKLSLIDFLFILVFIFTLDGILQLKISVTSAK